MPALPCPNCKVPCSTDLTACPSCGVPLRPGPVENLEDRPPLRTSDELGGALDRPQLLMRCPNVEPYPCRNIIRGLDVTCPKCGHLLPSMHGSVIQQYRITYVPRSPTDYSLYVLCRIGPPLRFLSSAPVKNIGIVVDLTPSPDGGHKMQIIQQALEYLVDQMEPDDVLTVAYYGSRGYLVMESEPVNDRKATKNIIKRKLDMQIGDGRNMYDGLQMVSKQVKKNATKDVHNQVLIMTDGPCSDEEAILREVREMSDLGIKTTMLGLGEGTNQDFMRDAAHIGGGLYYDRVDVPEIPEIFTQELRAVNMMYATHVELYLSAVGDFRPVHVFRVSPYISDLGELPPDTMELCLALQDLQLYDSQEFLLELLPITPRITTTRLLEARLVCDFPSEEVLNCPFGSAIDLPDIYNVMKLDDQEVRSHVRLVSIFVEGMAS